MNLFCSNNLHVGNEECYLPVCFYSSPGPCKFYQFYQLVSVCALDLGLQCIFPIECLYFCFICMRASCMFLILFELRGFTFKIILTKLIAAWWPIRIV